MGRAGPAARVPPPGRSLEESWLCSLALEMGGVVGSMPVHAEPGLNLRGQSAPQCSPGTQLWAESGGRMGAQAPNPIASLQAAGRLTLGLP